MTQIVILLSVLIVRVLSNGVPQAGVYLVIDLRDESRYEYSAECITDPDGFCRIDLAGLAGMMRGKIKLPSYGEREIIFYAQSDEMLFVLDTSDLLYETESEPYTEISEEQFAVLQTQTALSSSSVSVEDNPENFRQISPLLVLFAVGVVISVTLFLYNQIRKYRNL